MFYLHSLLRLTWDGYKKRKKPLSDFSLLGITQFVERDFMALQKPSQAPPLQSSVQIAKTIHP